MDAAEILAVGIHVTRKDLGVARRRPASRPIRPCVRVLDPPVRRIEHARQFAQRVQAVPVGPRIAAVDRLRVIEEVAPPGHELRVQVGDPTLVVGEESVVRAVRLEAVGDGEERLEVARLRPKETLLQRRDRPVHHREGNPAPTSRADHRPVVGSVGDEAAG